MAARSTRRAVRNADVARALRELALFLEMGGVAFKPRAYEKAAHTIESLERPVAEIDAEGGIAGLDALPAVGKGIAEKIDEWIRTGRIAELEELRAATPIDALGLTALEGVGPKHARALYEALGVRTLADLEAACREGRVRGVAGFGARSEAKIARALELQKARGGRRLLGEVLPLAREIAARLAEVSGVERAAYAGSVRRHRETIGDLDFVVAAAGRAATRAREAFLALPEVAEVYASGESKTLVRLASGIDADLRVVPPASFGAALAYFTGSKDHNVTLRRIAQERGLKLNEYGLFRGEKAIAGRTEEELYRALGLSLVPPELRENSGEIEAARDGTLPKLVEAGDLRGDLQLQTSWTDGAASIAEMGEAARALGLEYAAITDHTRDLAMARGCDEARLLEQKAEIAKLNRRWKDFQLLSGAEVNIRADGTLDVADEALAQLDFVGAALHTHFGQGRSEMTKRVIRALENPHVDVLFHPTARLIGEREPVALDMDAVIAAARRTGTALEIDAMPQRLDLRDEHVRKAVEAGVPLVIDSDAHAPAHLRYVAEYGVGVARRGWARKQDVLNALPLPKLRAALKDGRARGGTKPRGRA
ncbi:MAG TPA: DNA polymerase/3'-5' exonuclease PolX [Myxococcota bacterium]|jgi:DNA polymerase (family 10)|nr:DNA polymerase/3'-5' exonuclease PolX [Myxococcota bacterium]